MITQLTLPKPPSVNKAWRNVAGRGRVRTSAYKDWISQAGWQIKAQKPAPIDGHVVAIIGVERTNVRADIDNMVKTVFDLIAKHKIIENDNRVVGYAVAWNPEQDGLLRIALFPARDCVMKFYLAETGKHGGFCLSEFI